MLGIEGVLERDPVFRRFLSINAGPVLDIVSGRATVDISNCTVTGSRKFHERTSSSWAKVKSEARI